MLTIVLHPFWLNEKWWDTAASVLPNVVGFALGGYAIWLGFGDEEFRRRQATRKNGKSSPYVVVSASFAHFILVQLIALVFAIATKAFDYPLAADTLYGHVSLAISGDLMLFRRCLAPIGNCFGFFLFMYALMTAVAASMGIFRVTTWFERDEEQEATHSTDSPAQ
ncbi:MULTISPECIES: hypothetical protein [unclassified Cupriavidus]|uniref:hypothetical protein n=1 Tax=unclassified Cupriavidus TaxID=2640874 RepID=UPI00295F24E3|nr:hypothetical protein [Cupriavidus sp. TA19]